MNARRITPGQVATWRTLFTRGTMPASLAERKRVLADLAQRPVGSARALTDLHDLVLFALAHPADADERAALYLWALPLDLVDDLEHWPARERDRLVRAIKAKAGMTETQVQQQLARCTFLLKAWSCAAPGN